MLMILRSVNDPDPISLDITTEMQHGQAADVSSNAVENGTSYTDHKRVLPRTFSFSGIIGEEGSDPARAQRRSDGGSRVSLDPLAGTREVEPLDEGRAKGIVDALRSLFDSGEPLIFVSDVQRLERGFMTGLTVRQIGRRTFEVSGQYQEILVAQSRTAQVEITLFREDKKAQTEQSTKTKTATEQQKERALQDVLTGIGLSDFIGLGAP